MNFFYNLFICLYSLAIKIAANFNSKAALRVKGLKAQSSDIRNFKKNKTQCIWMHCASLGEFEQGRPLLQEFKKNEPNILRVLTFFSPSGYEKRKNTPEADYVFYLPDDTKRQARRFVKHIQPDIAVFIKYEFWFNHLKAIKQEGGKNILAAGLFRPEQWFFKPIRRLMPKVLEQFHFFFLQNNDSEKLLHRIGFQNTKITGDPRFDRVLEIAATAEPLPQISDFKANSLLLVAGSTWPPDEKLLAEYAQQHPSLKMIIAPHEIHEEHLNQIEKYFPKSCMRYSQYKLNPVDIRFLIIDNIGMLSKLYRYADLCYIGGGFGAGIHNSLEAAVYGKPVIFGPKYKKFSEAVDLCKHEAAFSIQNYSELKQISDKLINNKIYQNKAAKNARNYCKSMKGSTQKTYAKLLSLLK